MIVIKIKKKTLKKDMKKLLILMKQKQKDIKGKQKNYLKILKKEL